MIKCDMPCLLLSTYMFLLFQHLSLQINPLYNLKYFFLLILDSHENCETCLDVLQALENIDDDADRQNIALFKTTDAKFAEDIGISEFPSLGNQLRWQDEVGKSR